MKTTSEIASEAAKKFLRVDDPTRIRLHLMSTLQLKDQVRVLADAIREAVVEETAYLRYQLQLWNKSWEQENQTGIELHDKLQAANGELAIQMQKAYMRNDLESADRIAVLIGVKKPSDHEKEAL